MVGGEAKVAAEESLGGRRAEADEDLWPDQLDLPFQPGSTGGDLQPKRFWESH